MNTPLEQVAGPNLPISPSNREDVPDSTENKGHEFSSFTHVFLGF